MERFFHKIILSQVKSLMSDFQTIRQKETERQRRIHDERQRDGIEILRHRETDNQVDRHTDGQANSWT